MKNPLILKKSRFKIEKGIPYPGSRTRINGKKISPKKSYPFKLMKRGDSFSIGVIRGSNGDSDVKHRAIANAARNWKNKSGHKSWKFSARKMKDNSIRIWRIK